MGRPLDQPDYGRREENSWRPHDLSLTALERDAEDSGIDVSPPPAAA